MQKFNKGDWVQIAEDLRPFQRYAIADCEAIVIGSYADRYGRGNPEQYSIHIKNRGEVSWYSGWQLTLIEPGRLDKLKQWDEEAEAERKEKSDLDWIFSHGAEVLKYPPRGASVQALANCFDMTDLGGTMGEGITYYNNSLHTLRLAKPFLESGDKEGWLALCKAKVEIPS